MSTELNSLQFVKHDLNKIRVIVRVYGPAKYRLIVN